MEVEIKTAYPDARIRLVEGAGGVFEVAVDGEPVFSKLRLGRHPFDGEVMSLLNEKTETS